MRCDISILQTALSFPDFVALPKAGKYTSERQFWIMETVRGEERGGGFEVSCKGRSIFIKTAH